MKPRLLVESGVQAGEEFEIPPREETGEAVLGRDPACDIYVRDRHMSRRHGKLTYDGQCLFIEDLGSTNGTRVNDRLVTGKKELYDGDQITAGACTLLVRYELPMENAPANPQGANTVLADEPPTAVRSAPVPGETVVQEPPAPGVSLQGEEIAGYRVEANISDGPLANVYRARREDDGELAALKVIKPDAGATQQQKARFLRGARNAVNLSHPHLVAVWEAGEWQGTPFMAMEYVEGRDLKGLIGELPQPLGVGKALRMTLQMLAALNYVHEQGLVMRSVSPDNIMVVEGLDVKIASYGLLRHLPLSGQDHDITQVMDGGDFIDSRFAAPELINYPAVADQRADVFGAGACLYYMLTRTAPFPEQSDSRQPHLAFKRVPQDPAGLNPDVPADVGQIIVRSMAEYLDERYQTPMEMLKAVEAAQSALG